MTETSPYDASQHLDKPVTMPNVTRSPGTGAPAFRLADRCDSVVDPAVIRKPRSHDRLKLRIELRSRARLPLAFVALSVRERGRVRIRDREGHLRGRVSIRLASVKTGNAVVLPARGEHGDGHLTASGSDISSTRFAQIGFCP